MALTKLFIITYIAALVGVIPPGLVNMSVAKTCVERGRKNGMFAALGASVTVLFQALIAILLAKYIFDNPFVRNILLRTGLVIFGIMAIYFFVKAKQHHPEFKVPEQAGSRSFFKGFGVSALNIFPIPYFCVISTAFNAKGTVDYGNLEILLFMLAAGLGTFTTLYFYVLSFLKIESKTQTFSKYSNYFMAALMAILVVIALIRIYYPFHIE